MDQLDTTMLHPSQTAQPLKIAIKLGLSLVPFDSEEWIGLGGLGYSAKVVKLYWLSGSYFHSGPFHTPEHALNFLYEFYIEQKQREEEQKEERGEKGEKQLEHLTI